MYSLFIGAGLLGFAPIFVKLVTLGPTTIGFYRCALGSFFLFLMSFGRRPNWPKQIWGYIALAGVLFACDLFVWHRSVLYAGAGLGTILGNTQVFYVAAIGILFFGEKPTSRFLLAVLLAFLGTYGLVCFKSEASPLSEHYQEGVAYGLATGVIYSGYVLTIRRIERLSGNSSRALWLAAVSAVTAFSLLPVSLAEASLQWPTLSDLFWLVLLAAIAQVIAWLLISKNLKSVPVSRAGIILITQPLVATIAGALLFGERLHPIQWAGATLVFISLYLTASASSAAKGSPKPGFHRTPTGEVATNGPPQ